MNYCLEFCYFYDNLNLLILRSLFIGVNHIGKYLAHRQHFFPKRVERSIEIKQKF